MRKMYVHVGYQINELSSPDAFPSGLPSGLRPLETPVILFGNDTVRVCCLTSAMFAASRAAAQLALKQNTTAQFRVETTRGDLIYLWVSPYRLHYSSPVLELGDLVVSPFVYVPPSLYVPGVHPLRLSPTNCHLSFNGILKLLTSCMDIDDIPICPAQPFYTDTSTSAPMSSSSSLFSPRAPRRTRSRALSGQSRPRRLLSNRIPKLTDLYTEGNEITHLGSESLRTDGLICYIHQIWDARHCLCCSRRRCRSRSSHSLCC